MSQGFLTNVGHPLVRELAEIGAPIRMLVVINCQVLRIANESHHLGLKSPVTDRAWDEPHLTLKAFDLYVEDPTVG